MEPTAYVHIELDGAVRPVGRLWTSVARGKERASFDFDPEWLADPVHFALGPALPPTRGPFHSADGRAMFGALGDSAPDRWGRRLIARNEARRAREIGQMPRFPREIDYLLGVTDLVRQGALRFTVSPDGPYVAELGVHNVPPLVSLGELLAAARAIEDDDGSPESDDAVLLLLAPGSSLGGVRPKASIRDRDGALTIAKFPQRSDEVDVVRWESVMLGLAARAGIPVPAARIELIGDDAVLLIRRFDRVGDARVPFLSAMSLLDANDGEQRSYAEIADALRRIASEASADLAQLWRRLAFNILASNLDDHLRNHAVLYDGHGWRLSPAYDLNPVPRYVKTRHLSTAINIDDDLTASIDLAIDAAEEFRLTRDGAVSIAGEVATALSSWRGEAVRTGINAEEIDRMTTAFEHPDALQARRLVKR